MEQSVVARELFNGSITVVNLCVLFVLCRYVLRYYERGLPWCQPHDVKIAIALMTYFSGTTIRSVYVWSLLLTQNADAHYVTRAIDGVWHLLIFGSAVTVWGGLCLMSVFSPRVSSWRSLWWIIVAFAALSLPMLLAVLADWLT